MNPGVTQGAPGPVTAGTWQCGVLGFTAVRGAVLAAEGWDQNFPEPALSSFSIWGASVGVSYLLWELVKGVGVGGPREMWLCPVLWQPSCLCGNEAASHGRVPRGNIHLGALVVWY